MFKDSLFNTCILIFIQDVKANHLDDLNGKLVMMTNFLKQDWNMLGLDGTC